MKKPLHTWTLFKDTNAFERGKTMKLSNLKMTCSASPTQWIATNEEGQAVYIRYRFDRLTVHCPFRQEDDYQAFMAAQVFAMENVSGEEYRGAMETEEMLQLTGYTLESEAEV